MLHDVEHLLRPIPALPTRNPKLETRNPSPDIHEHLILHLSTHPDPSYGFILTLRPSPLNRKRWAAPMGLSASSAVPVITRKAM